MESANAGLHWIDSDTEDAMQDEHGFIWKAMLDTVDAPLAGARVLDVGCNQGGFLRLLADDADISEGLGYDPAAAAVRIANAKKGERHLTFATADTPPSDWNSFDVAFSHEVLYLIHDLESHARAVRNALRPGGIYYVVIGTHDRNPMMASWHREFSRTIDMPPIYSLTEVAGVFDHAGFEGSCGQLRYTFIPTLNHTEPELSQWLDYYHDNKLLFRFVRR